MWETSLEDLLLMVLIKINSHPPFTPRLDIFEWKFMLTTRGFSTSIWRRWTSSNIIKNNLILINLLLWEVKWSERYIIVRVWGSSGGKCINFHERQNYKPEKKSISIADIQCIVCLCLLIFIAKTRINHVLGWVGGVRARSNFSLQKENWDSWIML